MSKEARESHAVVCHVRLLPDNDDVELSTPGIEFHELLSEVRHEERGPPVSNLIYNEDMRQHGALYRYRTYMNAMPTMPSPTTTTRSRWPAAIFRRDQKSSGYLKNCSQK